MPYKKIFVKDGAYAASGYATMVNGNAYTAGTILKSNSFFLYVVSSGNAPAGGWSMPSGDPTADFVIGTLTVREISGLVGYDANPWAIACNSFIEATTVAGSQSTGFPKAGKLRDSANSYAGADILLASVSTFSAAGISGQSLNKEYYDVNHMIQGSSPRQFVTTTAPYPISPVRIFSADSSQTSFVYQKGAQITFQDNDVQFFGAGINEWRGVVFNVKGSQVSTISNTGTIGDSNTRNLCCNTFDDCTFNLRAGAVSSNIYASIAFGKLQESSSSSRVPLVGVWGTSCDYTEITNSTFSFSSGTQVVPLLADIRFDNCTFSSTAATMPERGIFGIGEAGAMFDKRTLSDFAQGSLQLPYAGIDKDVTFTGCTFSTPLLRLFRKDASGHATITFDGCIFPSSDFASYVSNIPSTTLAEVFIHFKGCGTSGTIDPTAHVFLTPRAQATKTKNVYRDGAALDTDGSQFSYYVRTLFGVSRGGIVQEMFPVFAAASVGLYECSMLVAAPPTARLTTDDFFVYAVGPDAGPASYATEAAEGVTADIVTRATTRQHFSAPPLTYPDAAGVIWHNLPSGWVVQRVTVVLDIPYNGRVCFLPFVAKSNAQFYLCPTIEFRAVS